MAEPRALTEVSAAGVPQRAQIVAALGAIVVVSMSILLWEMMVLAFRELMVLAFWELVVDGIDG